mgnify:CR=1 FL=1
MASKANIFTYLESSYNFIKFVFWAWILYNRWWRLIMNLNVEQTTGKMSLNLREKNSKKLEFLDHLGQS